MSKTLISVSIVAIAFAVSTPVFAETVDVFAGAGPLSVPVSYADLNVSSPAGTAVLKSRIDRAASTVCGGKPYIFDLKSQDIYQSCVKETVAAAISSSGISSLAALYGNQPTTLAQK